MTVLFFDGTGLCVFYKRLDRGTFRWPTALEPGQKTLTIEERTLETSIYEPCKTLRRIADAQGVSIDYAKPHGALYHDANRSRRLADVKTSVANMTTYSADLRVGLRALAGKQP